VAGLAAGILVLIAVVWLAAGSDASDGDEAVLPPPSPSPSAAPTRPPTGPTASPSPTPEPASPLPIPPGCSRWP